MASRMSDVASEDKEKGRVYQVGSCFLWRAIKDGLCGDGIVLVLVVALHSAFCEQEFLLNDAL